MGETILKIIPNVYVDLHVIKQNQYNRLSYCFREL